MKIRRTLTGALILGMIVAGCGTSGGGDVSPIQLKPPSTAQGGGTLPGVDEAEGGAEEFDAGNAELLVILDGWSKAIVGSGKIEWSAGTGGGKQELTFRRATAEDFKNLALRDPSAVQQIVARTYTGDPAVNCGENGCTISGRDVLYNEIANPQTGSLGGMYKEWGIDSTAWVAGIKSNTAVLWYGTNKLEISKYAGISEDQLISDSGVRAVSSAFGVLFNTTAQWVSGDRAYQIRDYVAGTPKAGVVAGDFMKGLATFVSGVESLGDAQLTWRSSPTTGCGVGVLCVPTKIETKISGQAPESSEFCNGTGKVGVEFGAVDVEINYEKSVNQFGVWGDSIPDGALGGRPGIWIKTPPYVKGVVKTHHTYVHLYDSVGLYEKLGRVSTIDVDPISDTTYIPKIEDVLKILGEGWQKC